MSFKLKINKLMKDTNIYCTDDIQRRHKGTWFSKEDMQFFGTRLSQTIYPNPETGLIYFVTSECTQSNRRYSIRVYNPEADSISTTGEGYFQYSTLYHAKAHAKRLSKGKE